MPVISTLEDRATALQRAMLARGWTITLVEAGEAIAEIERASWRPVEEGTGQYGELLWPCGHVQTAHVGRSITDWYPRPTHWRPIYVPPALVQGRRPKGLAGSVMSGRIGHSSVAGTSE